MKIISQFRKIRLRLRLQDLDLKSKGGKLVVDMKAYNNLDEVAAVHDKPYPPQERNQGRPKWAQYGEGSLAARLVEALRWRKKREQIHKRRHTASA